MERKRLAVVNYDLGEENIALLKRRFPQCAFHVRRKGDEAPDADVLARAEVFCGYVLDGSIFEKAPNLRFVHTLNAGVDGVMGALPAHVRLSSGAGVYGVPLGEHVMALLLALLRGLHLSVRNMAKEKAWHPFPILGRVAGSRAAVLGTGDIGRYVAKSLKGMGAAHVAGYKLHPAEAQPPFDALYTGPEGLYACLKDADFVLVCLPGTPFTKKCIDAAAFARMKEGCIFVNIGRGGIVDTDALMEALRSGRVAAAGLDVSDPEPLPPEHPLWDMENVLLSPHYAGWSARLEDLAGWFAQNLEAYLAGADRLPGEADRKYMY